MTHVYLESIWIRLRLDRCRVWADFGTILIEYIQTLFINILEFCVNRVVWFDVSSVTNQIAIYNSLVLGMWCSAA